jgi:hypothetical protein
MKTILIILLSIVGGICFYISDPLIIDTPAQVGALISVLGIGLLVGSIISRSDDKKTIKALRLINKSLLNGTAKQRMDDFIIDHKNEEIIKLKAANHDLLLKEKSFNALYGNHGKLQKKYELLKLEKEELSKANDSNTFDMFNLMKKNEHLKKDVEEQDKMLKFIGNSLSEKV